MVDALQSFWRRGRRVERAGYVISVLLLTSGLMHLAILLATGGSWEGPLSWRKPAAFGVSFGLTLATVIWVSSFVALRERTRLALLGSFIAACAWETALVSVQTWRGVPSHFNVETVLDGTIARGLAAGGLALVVIIFVLTRAAFRPSPGVPVSLRIAIQIGFLILCGAMAVGAVMIARGMMLVFAGDAAAAYATGGALKPTHAVTMHAILVLPALAWLLSFADMSERRRLKIVLIAAAGYAGLTVLVAVANFSGWQPHDVSVAAHAAMGMCVLAVIATAIVALVAVVRGPRAHGIQHA